MSFHLYFITVFVLREERKVRLLSNMVSVVINFFLKYGYPFPFLSHSVARHFLKNSQIGLVWETGRMREILRVKMIPLGFYENIRFKYWWTHSLSLMGAHSCSYFTSHLIYLSIYLCIIFQSTPNFRHTTLKFARAPSINERLA